jgi:hypothetical protein
LNNISGDEFIKEGEKETEVTITTSHKKQETVITRRRSASGVVNTYEIDDRVHKAFGQGVPRDIAAHLALNEINFQGQHDSPFWFSETPGEVSRRLNAVIDLSVIDSSLSCVAQEVRANQDRTKLCEERLQKATSELTALAPQQARIGEFHRLEGLEEESFIINKELDRLNKLVQSIITNRAKEYEVYCEAVAYVFCLAREVKIITKQENTLEDLIAQIERYRNKSTPPPDLTDVWQAHQNLVALDRQIDTLEDHIYELKQNELEHEKALMRAKVVATFFNQETKGQKCPLCGNPIR